MKKNLFPKVYLFKIIITLAFSISFVVLIIFYDLERDREKELITNLQNEIIEQIQTKESNDWKAICTGRSIFLYEAINEMNIKNIIGSLFQLESRNKNDIDLYINATTGSFKDSFALIGVMDSLKCKVNTIATGVCGSKGSLILCSGTGRIEATKNSIITIYIPGKSDIESEEKFDYLKKVRIRSFWQSNKKIKLPAKWFDKKDEEYHYLSPNEALSFKLIDKIVD